MPVTFFIVTVSKNITRLYIHVVQSILLSNFDKLKINMHNSNMIIMKI